MYSLKCLLISLLALYSGIRLASQEAYRYVPITLEEIEQGVPFIIASDAERSRVATVLYGDGTLHSEKSESDYKFFHAVAAESQPGFYQILQENDLVLGVIDGNDVDLTKNDNPYWQFEQATEAPDGQFKIKNKANRGDSERYLSFSGEYVKNYTTSGMDRFPYLFKREAAVPDEFHIGETGYATLYVDHAFIMPEGVTGGYVTESVKSLNAGEGPTYELHYNWAYTPGAVVPALTPLVLKAEASGTAQRYTYVRTQSQAEAPTGNMLHGSLTDALTQAEGDNYYYQLSYNNDTDKVLGFWWGAEDGGAFTNAANKAYLAIPKDHRFENSTLGFDLEGNITGISRTEAEAPSGAPQIFSLDGRRIDAAQLQRLPAGVYIVNGKKTLVP